MQQGVAEFAALVNRARHIGGIVAGNAIRPGELPEQPLDAIVIALDVTLAMDTPGGGAENTVTELGKGAGIKIMDGSLICHPRVVEHFRTIAEREGIPYQMEILPAGGTDAGGVQRLNGGIPAFTLSIPCRYVHTVNEMVNGSDVQACIDLLARYLEEVHTADYSL